MTDLPVSVIIVSRGRPELLARCLLGVSQLCYHPFEVVVVSDQAGLSALDAANLSIPIKTALFDVANISQARNIGLSLAAGQVIAFIDDDAVPEPGWLYHLAAGFQNPDVMSAGGYVLGRNGISYQTTAQTIDKAGVTQPLKTSDTSPVIVQTSPAYVIKTEGTNCAFRRSIFTRSGGFDTNFHYFMDEADLNIRLAHMGCKAAIVPRAVVHHNRAGSDQRLASQMPKSLLEIGASTTIFLRKHAPVADQAVYIANARTAQRRILLRHMIAGTCEPKDITRLLGTFDEGIATGQQRSLILPPKIDKPISEFLASNAKSTTPTHQLISGYRINAGLLRKKARSAVRPGNIVSLYVVSRTILFHKISFHPDGYWQQTGGLFGRSVRVGQLFRATSLAERIKDEDLRIAPLRHPWQL
ncbi:MAG: glycosyltransferase family 2 protein [Paracoccaceae bacterium]